MPDARHRLLEGFLWRLARCSDDDAFALRGGMLVRSWFPGLGRFASDIDLVCSLPYDVADMRERMTKVLAAPSDDGVEMEFERVRLDAIWPDDAHPGMRLFVQATIDGEFDELHVDITFNLPIWPHATRAPLGDEQVWVCPPSMLIGRKLRVTSELGRRFWRPKDIADLWMMLRHRTPDTAELGEAIERTFGVDVDALALVGERLVSPEWNTPYAAQRWRRFAGQHRGLRVPRDIVPVIEEVRSHLEPVLSPTLKKRRKVAS